jgi:hypothetical protein
MPLQSDEKNEQGGRSLIREVIPAMEKEIYRKLPVSIAGLWAEILARDLSYINHHLFTSSRRLVACFKTGVLRHFRLRPSHET